MSRPDADRNLLFGILALQMDFITRDALISGMNAWLLEKSRPLGDLLVERGELDSVDRGLLDPMVDRHVAKHGGNPLASLAALGSVGEVTTDLRRSVASDPDLLTSLDSVGTRAEDPHATRSIAPAYPPSSAVRFRKIRHHAAGNLGVVYVARDEELNREVALKEIKEKNADHPHSQAKFLLEAEVTGGLEHPGIVPVYGLGHHDDGRPFYAMRFIRGKSLLDAIKRFHADDSLKNDPGQRLLALQKLLHRFTDVCNAMAYAHSRGILHRDLKPDNVMVGKYGETLVVDWGLAKALGRSGEVMGASADPDDPLPEASLQPSSADRLDATQDGSLVGTPAYMSPEQAAGRLDLLGPASDIYGLGATLYHLIVGRTSLEAASLGDLLAKIQAGEIIRPRTLAPWLDPALEAICLKAMALRPEDRYATPRALSEDLDRWIASEPVDAYPEPFARRARRWARRHKTPVAIAGSLVAASVVAMAIGLVLVRREQARTEVQRDLAAKNFRQARHAADGFLTRISEDPQLAQPGLQPLRRRLLEAGLSYYEGFAREGVDPGDHARLADAKARVGRINDLIGSKEVARAHFQEALEFQEKAARSRPDDPEASRLLVTTLDELGAVQLATGRPTEALTSFERARELAERLAREHPGDPDVAASLADTYARLGEWQHQAGDRPKAIEFHQKALVLFEKLASTGPPSARSRSDLALGLANLGIIQGEERHFIEALESFRRAIDLRESLVRDDPTNPGGRSALAAVNHYIGAIHHGNRQFDEALASFQSARGLREELVAINTVVRYQVDLAKDLNDIGTVQREAGRPEESLRSHEKAREIGAQVARFHPTVPEYRNGLAESLIAIGRLYSATNRPVEALPAYREAQALLETLVRENPVEANFQVQLASVCEHIGNQNANVIDGVEALRSQSRARELREKLIRDHPEDVEYVNALSNSFMNQGVLRAKAGNPGEAIEFFRKSRDLRLKVIATRPDDINTKHILALILENLGVWLEKTDQRPDALAAFTQAVENQRAAFRKAPQEVKYRRFLGMHYESLARVQRALNRPAEAAETATERQKLWPDDPTALYQSARELALCILLTGPAELENLSAKAMDALRRAVGLGFNDLGRLQNDKDLNPLRPREDFIRLLKEVEEKARGGATPGQKEKP
jgi:eukaryotic-like serine/threonine-protein kinase